MHRPRAHTAPWAGRRGPSPNRDPITGPSKIDRKRKGVSSATPSAEAASRGRPIWFRESSPSGNGGPRATVARVGLMMGPRRLLRIAHQVDVSTSSGREEHHPFDGLEAHTEALRRYWRRVAPPRRFNILSTRILVEVLMCQLSGRVDPAEPAARCRHLLDEQCGTAWP